jgi:hydroxylamine reductase
MFCFQCEQTAGGIGCTRVGVCGKRPEVAALQDLLIYSLKGLSVVAIEARKLGKNIPEVNHFIVEAMFSTLTNVNFNPERFIPLISRSVELRENLKEQLSKRSGSYESKWNAETFIPADTMEDMVTQSEGYGVKSIRGQIRF